MKPIYKCDYCTTLLPEDECRIHEPQCYYNPKNKSCYSCKNARLHTGSLEYCKINERLTVDHSFYAKVIPNTNCEKWENGKPSDMRGV